MSTICIVHKAITTAGYPPPDLSITASEVLPEFASISISRATFVAEAESLYTALANSLPGGTLDHLLSIMLREKASHFTIRSWAGTTK